MVFVNDLVFFRQVLCDTNQVRYANVGIIISEFDVSLAIGSNFVILKYFPVVYLYFFSPIGYS
jgi:hypothetical protein